MIEKERLKKLIKQEAIIWVTDKRYDNGYYYLGLLTTDIYIFQDDSVLFKCKGGRTDFYNYKDLCETKAEAVEYARRLFNWDEE